MGQTQHNKTEGLDEGNALLSSFQELQNYTDNGPGTWKGEEQQTGILETSDVEDRRLLVGRLLDYITVEPVLFLHITAWMIEFLFSTQLLLEKVCDIHFQYPSQVCKNLTYHEEENVAVQRLSANYLLIKNLISNLPSVFFVLFLGSWSDKNGRKLPMLLPAVGSFIATIYELINAYVWWLPPEWLILGGIPKALSGGVITLLMASYAYLSDVTTVQSRTVRMAFLNFVMYIGPPIGLYSRNPLFESLNYVGVFGVSAAMYLFCSIYICIRFPSGHSPQAVEDQQLPMEGVRDRSVAGPDTEGWSSIFDTKHIKETVYVIFKRRPGNRRFNLICLIINLCLLTFLFGTDPLEYLFTIVKFHWSYNEYSYFAAYTIIIASLGSTLLMPLLSYKMGVDDVTLGAVGCFARVVGFTVEGLVTQPYLLYVVSFLGILPQIVTRAALSKEVPPDELGKAFSMAAAWQAVVPNICIPIYTVLYDVTIQINPGYIFLLSAAVSALATLIFIYMLVVRWRSGDRTSSSP